MKITLRGWSRDMGTKEVVDLSLSDVGDSEDGNRSIRRDRPGIFTAPGRTFIAWFQRLQHMGKYRMEIELTNDDIIRLFKIKFGTELREWLVDREGFTFSPELTKRALRTVKLSEVTLADLAALTVAPSEESEGQDTTAKEGASTPPRLRLLRRPG
jgi:hypothetical protein